MFGLKEDFELVKDIGLICILIRIYQMRCKVFKTLNMKCLIA